MITITEIIKKISKDLNIDEQVVSVVCRHPFEYTVERMKNEETRDILFNRLFKFKLKSRFKNKDDYNEDNYIS